LISGGCHARHPCRIQAFVANRETLDPSVFSRLLQATELIVRQPQWLLGSDQQDLYTIAELGELNRVHDSSDAQTPPQAEPSSLCRTVVKVLSIVPWELKPVASVPTKA
jgi:hypothetical protein